jgi:hypothetical protein
MSKSVVIIVVAVIALVAAGGTYHFMSQEPQAAPTAPALTERVEPPASTAPSTPKPDHGNFQKRFQPSMPPARGTK